MKTVIHALAGSLALLLIASFWSATLVSELFLDSTAIRTVKQGIVAGLFVLIPCLAVSGASGALLGRGRSGRLLKRKRKRMAMAAANGLLVLLPAALYLNAKAQTGTFDTAFLAVQGLELVAGAGQFLLLALNARDGRRLSGRLR